MLLFPAICKRQFRVSRHLESASNGITKQFNFLQFTFIPDFSIPALNYCLILLNFKHFKTFNNFDTLYPSTQIRDVNFWLKMYQIKNAYNLFSYMAKEKKLKSNAKKKKLAHQVKSYSEVSHYVYCFTLVSC